MRTGRLIPKLTVTEQEREMLQQWARRAKTAQGLAQRARIILASSEDKFAGRVGTALDAANNREMEKQVFEEATGRTSG
jgi:hypothetical protein